MALALLAGSPEEKTRTEEWEEIPYWTRAEMCSHEWRKKKKLKESEEHEMNIRKKMAISH